MTFATIDLLCPHCYKIHNGKCAKVNDSKAGRDDLSDIPMKERKKLFNALLEIEPRSNNLSLPTDKPNNKLEWFFYGLCVGFFLFGSLVFYMKIIGRFP